MPWARSHVLKACRSAHRWASWPAGQRSGSQGLGGGAAGRAARGTWGPPAALWKMPGAAPGGCCVPRSGAGGQESAQTPLGVSRVRQREREPGWRDQPSLLEGAADPRQCQPHPLGSIVTVDFQPLGHLLQSRHQPLGHLVSGHANPTDHTGAEPLVCSPAVFLARLASRR